MDPSCLQHRLTDDERRTFEETGILQIENALSPDHLAELTQTTDRLHAQESAAGRAKPDAAMFYPNFVPVSPLYTDLVDYDRILPKVWGILGWNIYLYHAHLIVTPPSGQQRTDKTFGWHQDSGRVNFDMEESPRPRLSIKVAYFLSDTSEEGRGNFWVVPGSHRKDRIEVPDGKGQPEGAVPVLAKPGTAVFFDRRLWHAASPNWSDVTRKVLFYGYGYRWIRTKDDMTVHDLWPTSDPIRRQLLGYALNANGHYSPTDEDVPLRGWLKEHSPQDVR
ncbi:phytanoyl-CoA dioxygenase family protein [Actinopolymorpha singaporensis]|uniref:Phytanoyl-CoA dioxygenase (PhyH) n=1 Tax=Actinopolymorpha singaporensis TaxID=117157 RepID=A0A1H1VWD0_9ACTN|nr:phytanoyl-CoA dioxygenase family protein [Actinopolymorpha singaporensis]SDS89308.1 Phytanoyl-CoA dioxygenase (PhyH) [Actinopolymorpha singaporensis]